MRVIPFPGGSDTGPEESWLAEIEAALNGDVEGVVADSWRALREDVRALAPPMDPEFERQLRARIAERDASLRDARSRGARPQGARSGPQQPHRRGVLRRWGASRGLARRRLAWLPRHRLTALGAATAVTVVAVVVALVIALPRPTGRSVQAVPAPAVSNAGRAENSASASAVAASNAPSSASAGAASNAPASAPAAGGVGSVPGRVQQLGASITLTATPEEVQTVADRVSRLTTSDGGFVQSSHVNVGQGTGEANLTLSLPSTKLSGALASLGEIAAVRDESQSLQDITNTYDAARQRLSDANAERQALLHALSKATTEGQIDSLRERLAQNRGAIAQAHTAFQAVSQRASTSEVEVTVIGDAHAGSEALTLHRGLHDAGRVLVVTLVVLLIAAAVLVPLALVILALTAGRRTWRRHQRERVLDTR